MLLSPSACVCVGRELKYKTRSSIVYVCVQDLDELEQEVDQMAPEGETDDCDCGMDTGEELIEAHRGMLAVSSQALLTTQQA
jgi:hypothetical protein